MATINVPRSKSVSAPGGPVDILVVDFTTSGTTSGVTTNEARGCSVARTGVGVFVVTLNRAYKHFSVGMSVQAATTAQLFIITARTASTITLTQVTAGGGTAVDTLAARINMTITARVNS